jgi:hypothetical protein
MAQDHTATILSEIGKPPDAIGQQFGTPPALRSPRTETQSVTSEVPEHFTGKELADACISTDATYIAVCLGYAKSYADEIALLSFASADIMRVTTRVDVS